MAALFSPYGNGQFMDASGNPAVGYKLFTYLAGSSTPVVAYTDAGGLVAQTNPIILDSLGQVTNGQLWLAVGTAYKFVLQDAFGAMVDTVDNVTGIASVASAINQFQASGVTPTYVSSNSFTLSGDQTTEFHVGRRVQATVTGGIVYGTIVSSVYTSLTTIVITPDGVALDAGLSAVNLSILRADQLALPLGSPVMSGAPNYVTNGSFLINDRALTSPQTLAAGARFFGMWKAGASGATVSWATVNGLTTVTISAGSLINTIANDNVPPGVNQMCLSWVGTSQGKIGAGSAGISARISSVTGGSNLALEFSTGTLTNVKLEKGVSATAFSTPDAQQEKAKCMRHYRTPNISLGIGAVGSNVQFGGEWANGPMFGAPVITTAGITAVAVGSTGWSATLSPNQSGIILTAAAEI